MKKWVIVLALFAGICASTSYADVRIGDSRLDVVAALGEPQAVIESGSFQLLTFERGRVELRNDKVTLVDLISAEEAANRRALAEKRAAEAEQVAAQQKIERVAEGLAVLERMKTDTAILDSRAADQVSYWRSFRARYPEINTSAEYAAALQRLEAELDNERRAAEQGRQLLELEARVADAERRAANAEASARRSYSDYGYYPPVVYQTASYVTAPVCPTPVLVTPSYSYIRPIARSYYPRQHSGVYVSFGGGFSSRSAFSTHGGYSSHSGYSSRGAFSSRGAYRNCAPVRTGNFVVRNTFH